VPGCARPRGLTPGRSCPSDVRSRARSTTPSAPRRGPWSRNGLGLDVRQFPRQNHDKSAPPQPRAGTRMRSHRATPSPSNLAQRTGGGVPGRRTLTDSLQRKTAPAPVASAGPLAPAASALEDPFALHLVAEHGTASGGAALPHRDAIQASFGHHPVSQVAAHVGGAAAAASRAVLGARGVRDRRAGRVRRAARRSAHRGARGGARGAAARAGSTWRAAWARPAIAYEQSRRRGRRSGGARRVGRGAARSTRGWWRWARDPAQAVRAPARVRRAPAGDAFARQAGDPPGLERVPHRAAAVSRHRRQGPSASPGRVRDALRARQVTRA
jgi:hypothetical protein